MVVVVIVVVVVAVAMDVGQYRDEHGETAGCVRHLVGSVGVLDVCSIGERG